MTEFADKPSYAFNPGAPPEVSNFLRNKALRPSFSWQDMEPEEHAIAFTVAKAMQTDVLETIRGAVQKALDEGQTFETFQKNLRPELERLGWWGKAKVTDPVTGKVVDAQLGSPRRLRTIYRANIRSARAAGQWERIERSKDALPWLQYNLGPSERHRPHHEAKAGLVLRADDPFWDAWMPPNGWGCKCWVRQISSREAARMGVNDAPDVPEIDVSNSRTGEIRRVPEGIDPGWHRNPGKLRRDTIERHLTDGLASADPATATAVVRDIATSWRARRVLDGGAGGDVPIGIAPPEVAQAVGLKRGVVSMSDDYGTKFVSRDRAVSTDTLAELSDAMRTGSIAREVQGDTVSLIVFSKSEKPWRFVLKVLADRDELWVSTIHRTEPRKWRALKKRAGITVLRE